MRHLPIRECFYALCFLLLLTVLYVFSVGPVCWLDSTGRLPGDIASWQAFYRPLKWVDDSTPLDGCVRAYSEWWSALGR
jgi:hypothetical protein